MVAICTREGYEGGRDRRGAGREGSVNVSIHASRDIVDVNRGGVGRERLEGGMSVSIHFIKR